MTEKKEKEGIGRIRPFPSILPTKYLTLIEPVLKHSG
jgi:hypothetical protein